MKKIENYFEKNGKIYGVSSKFAFKKWEHYIIIFNNLEKAYKWLQTEEYDFRERELMSRSAAIKLAGKKAVETAEMEG